MMNVKMNRRPPPSRARAVLVPMLLVLLSRPEIVAAHPTAPQVDVLHSIRRVRRTTGPNERTAAAEHLRDIVLATRAGEIDDRSFSGRTSGFHSSRTRPKGRSSVSLSIAITKLKSSLVTISGFLRKIESSERAASMTPIRLLSTDRAMRCARSRSSDSFSISVLSPFREYQFGCDFAASAVLYSWFWMYGRPPGSYHFDNTSPQVLIDSLFPSIRR
jgi:hypothetical protein